jgi:hypothetical protein
MRLTSPAIQRLLNQQERALVEAASASNVKELSEARLRGKVTRARALKDKYAGLARERARSARGKAKTRTATSKRTDDQTMATKAEVFGDVLARFEKQLAKVEKASAKKGSSAGRSVPRTSKPAERRKTRRATKQATRGATKVERKVRASAGLPEVVGKRIGTAAGVATTTAASMTAAVRKAADSARRTAESARKSLAKRPTVAQRRKKAERMSKEDLKAKAQKLVAKVQRRVAEQTGTPTAVAESSPDTPDGAPQAAPIASLDAETESMQARSADAKGSRVQHKLAKSHVTRMQGHVLGRGQRSQARRDSR